MSRPVIGRKTHVVRLGQLAPNRMVTGLFLRDGKEPIGYHVWDLKNTPEGKVAVYNPELSTNPNVKNYRSFMRKHSLALLLDQTEAKYVVLSRWWNWYHDQGILGFKRSLGWSYAFTEARNMWPARSREWSLLTSFGIWVWRRHP